jgi:hypothetical protein
MRHACLVAVLILIVGSYARAEDTPTTQPASPTTRPADMPADQLLQQMLRPQSQGPRVKPLQPILNPPVLDQTTGKNVVPGSALPINLKREGDYIRERIGRLTPSADGTQMELTFESDGRTMQDPPIIVLPNLKLMSMEEQLKSAGRDLQFRVTGMLTEYKGRNYILLERVSVVQQATQQF